MSASDDMRGGASLPLPAGPSSTISDLSSIITPMSPMYSAQEQLPSAGSAQEQLQPVGNAGHAPGPQQPSSDPAAWTDPRAHTYSNPVFSPTPAAPAKSAAPEPLAMLYSQGSVAGHSEDSEVLDHAARAAAAALAASLGAARLSVGGYHTGSGSETVTAGGQRGQTSRRLAQNLLPALDECATASNMGSKASSQSSLAAQHGSLHEWSSSDGEGYEASCDLSPRAAGAHAHAGSSHAAASTVQHRGAQHATIEVQVETSKARKRVSFVGKPHSHQILRIHSAEICDLLTHFQTVCAASAWCTFALLQYGTSVDRCCLQKETPTCLHHQVYQMPRWLQLPLGHHMLLAPPHQASAPDAALSSPTKAVQGQGHARSMWQGALDLKIIQSTLR